MKMENLAIGNDIDLHVDDEIYNCLNFDDPKSFFLFAGAGSGKTKSLVNVLKKIKENHKNRLVLGRQKIAIITYTNAACNEIIDRLGNDSTFFVSTIHSFIWDLIKYYHVNIREWVRVNLNEEIVELIEKEKKGRAGTQASIDRQAKIISKEERLSKLNSILKFTYNPNGDIETKDSLNHSEVIYIGASFLANLKTMQRILVNKFPILLIDESQDTKKELIDAFFEVQKSYPTNFSLGLFGDTMQRIYSDGKENIENSLPDDWIKPIKKMNHRCPKRIVTLINKIRQGVDNQQQISRIDKEDGFVRLFLIEPNSQNKICIENSIAKEMSEITQDCHWNSDVKILTIEHHMAAKRMGFSELFEPLYTNEKLKTGVLNGELDGLKFFTEIIVPLIIAKQDNDNFEISRIIRNHSPFLDKNYLKNCSDQTSVIREANDSVKKLFSLWENEIPLLRDIVNNIMSSKLFLVPENLRISAISSDSEISDQNENVTNSWRTALSAPFTQILFYKEYITDNARFGTHQGVKGLQFPRVMVIIDDSEARGFMFNYDKLFGTRPQTQADINNLGEGKETIIDRTRRLFYVTCSRAEKSLAIVLYTTNAEEAKRYVISENWFAESEIRIF